jgi:molybdopterin-guanine dinucleotide biosynthesis protein A
MKSGVVAGSIIETAERESLPLPVTGLILGGGQSRRMGAPKSFLPYKKSTFVEERLHSLKQLFQQVLIVTNSPSDFDSLEADVVKDIIPQRGPLVGILSGLLVCQQDYVFVIACDMPLVDNRLIRSICSRRHGRDVVVLKHEQGVEPLLGIYSRKLAAPLEEFVFSGQARAQDFLSGLNCAFHEIKSQGEELPSYFNVNTPQDYARVLE